MQLLYSLWANEQNHATVDIMMEKMLEDHSTMSVMASLLEQLVPFIKTIIFYDVSNSVLYVSFCSLVLSFCLFYLLVSL